MKGFIDNEFTLTVYINNINQKVENLEVFNLIDCLAISKIDYTIVKRSMEGSTIELILKQEGQTWQARLRVDSKVKGSKIDTSFKYIGKSQTSKNTLLMLFDVELPNLNSLERLKLVDRLSKPLNVDEVYNHALLALHDEHLINLKSAFVPESDFPDFEQWKSKYLPLLPESKKPIYGKAEIKEDSTKELKVKREKVKREKKLIHSIEDLKEVQDDLAGKQDEVSNV